MGRLNDLFKHPQDANTELYNEVMKDCHNKIVNRNYYLTRCETLDMEIQVLKGNNAIELNVVKIKAIEFAQYFGTEWNSCSFSICRIYNQIHII